MHMHPLVLEARFRQLAVASGEGTSRAVIVSTAAQARLALRGFEALAQHDDTARLGCAASRLARRFAAPRGAFALAQIVLRLGIEMGQRLEPFAVSGTVRNVLDGRAEQPAFATPGHDHAEAHTILFTQIALVAAITHTRLS